MTKVQSVNFDTFTLITDDGQEHKLFPHEYWTLCPTRTFWAPNDGPIKPRDFGMLRNNALSSNGLVLAHEDLTSGIGLSTQKEGSAREAELLLEKIRKENFPHLPSRLRCHFLNYDKETAQHRAEDWGWQRRSLERCYLVLSSGYFHYADVSIFEKLANGESEQKLELANEYWKTFQPSSVDEFKRLEVLANSCLYFPDWNEFIQIDRESLVRFNDAFMRKN